MQAFPLVAVNRGILVILFAVLYGSMQSIAYAGAWLRSEGESYYSASMNHAQSNASWDENGDSSSSSCTSKNWHLGQSYEYGYSYYYTLLGKLGYTNTRCGVDSAQGLTDLQLGIRGRLDRYRNGRAWEAMLIIPTGYSEDKKTRIGYGRVGLELGVDFREKLSQKAYGSFGARVRFWDGPPAHQFITHVGASMRFNDKWSLTGKITGNFSFGNGEQEAIAFVNSDHLAEFDVIKPALTMKYKLDERTGLTFGVAQNVWGRNVSKSTTGSIGIYKVWGR